MKPPKNTVGKLLFALALALTLGLAPFYPSPHIIGKLKWVAGGAIGMQPMDYFDLVLHGFPWLYLVYRMAQFIATKKKNDT